MAMVVRTNTMAMNANRQLSINNSNLSKSLEKLSSGYKINRAGDDAAGLAISEKMKAQIKGLDQAASNAQDGISLVQTAEGATTEIHNMLNRMVELATKSANGTIDNSVDRAAIQTEVDSLSTEITRITDSTNFNGITLLNGNLGSTSKATVSAATINGADATISTVPAAASSFTSGAVTAGTAGAAKLTVTYTDASGKERTKEVSYTATAAADTNAAAMKDALSKDATISSLFDVTGDNTGLKLVSKDKGASAAVVTGMVDSGAKVAAGTSTAGADSYNTINMTSTKAGDSVTVNGKVYEFVAAAGDATTNTKATAVVLGADDAASTTNLAAALKKDGVLVDGTTLTSVSFKTDPDAAAKGLTLQIGDTAEEFNKVTVSIDDLSAKGLGINDLNVSTQETAGDAIDTIKNAINKVSTNRANLGALQNRMEYTINNLNTTSENMSTANSRIRDTDMASEMTSYTQNNILTQAAQAMLAQANQAPQQILQLLQ